MKRDIEYILIQWKTDNRRLPLLIRGARQVGKSYTITDFGKKHFENLVTVNFEQYPEYKRCFPDFDPLHIIQNISILGKQEIVPGKTLLFFDEIQECPAAIVSLRYFYEQLPSLHVIGAGSLLEFALASEKIKMPVGRVQYLYMKPLSFGEFLDASGNENARNLIKESSPDRPIPEAIHEHLLVQLGKYLILGGMPGVLDEFLATGNLEKCKRIQQAVIQTYRDDFGKYANLAKHKYLIKVFDSIPLSVGTKFRYSKVDPDIQSRDLREAVHLLQMAGVLHIVKKTSGHAVPLEVNSSDTYYKCLFCDTGLMQLMCGLTGEINFSDDVISINRGAVAEQCAGQELLAYQDCYINPRLYYWVREKRGSSAEVDYLITRDTHIIPLEIKAGKTGRLKSLHLYNETYNPLISIKISSEPFGRKDNILCIPLYAIESIKNLKRMI